MFTAMLLAITLAADPAPSTMTDLDRAWEQVQLGSEIIKAAVERHPTIAAAQAERAQPADPFDCMDVVDNAEIAREGMAVTAINAVVDAFSVAP